MSVNIHPGNKDVALSKVFVSTGSAHLLMLNDLWKFSNIWGGGGGAFMIEKVDSPKAVISRGIFLLNSLEAPLASISLLFLRKSQDRKEGFYCFFMH